MSDAESTRTADGELSSQGLISILARYPQSPRYWIAYSGGLDSTALLHLAARLNVHNGRFRFSAIHINHGLHEDADQWAGHCMRVCDELGIDCHIQRVDVRAQPGRSLEEIARMARYRAILQTIGGGDTVLMAQHQDDQAETLLLQLFRGAGLAGLAAMPEHATLSRGFLLRPFLSISRKAIADYGVSHNLKWIDDPSNSDPVFDRNFLRNEIIPQIRKHWPGMTQTVARTARHCAEAMHMLDQHMQQLLGACLNRDDNSLDGDRLAEFTDEEQSLILRGWIKQSGYRSPSAHILEQMLTEGLGAGTDRNPLVVWPEGTLRRYRSRLHLLPVLPPFNPADRHAWDTRTERLVLPQTNGELVVTLAPEGGIPLALWQSASVSIAYRQGGEKMRLPKRQGSHELKKLFQEAGVPPWIRERTPLVYLNGELAWVGCGWIAAAFISGNNPSPCIKLQWIRPPGLYWEPDGHQKLEMAAEVPVM